LFRSKCAKMSRFPSLFAMETWVWGGDNTRSTSPVKCPLNGTLPRQRGISHKL
jgi:hypothetical protein